MEMTAADPAAVTEQEEGSRTGALEWIAPGTGNRPLASEFYAVF